MRDSTAEHGFVRWARKTGWYSLLILSFLVWLLIFSDIGYWLFAGIK